MDLLDLQNIGIYYNHISEIEEFVEDIKDQENNLKGSKDYEY